MQKPVFASVIIPTFNQANFLPAALDSVLAQTDGDWEAIVVNDGSTDGTAEIAESYAQRDSRIRCIHKPNGGVASALNVGLANATGEWVHWLSSDDIFEPKKLAINRYWAQKFPDTKFFFSYFTLLSQATQVREKRELWGPLPDPHHQILTLLFRNYVSGISICVDRVAWKEVGCFDESLYYAQDYDRWLHLLQRHQGRFIPEWTVISRNHADQGSETFPDACYFDTAKAAIRFLNKHSFPELVPWVNLNDEAAAIKAVSSALDVACERSSFLYALGPHPALVLRILEWVLSTESIHAVLKEFVRSRIGDMALQEGDDDWAWMWRQLAVATQGQGNCFHYSPIDILQLAIREYRSRLYRGDVSSRSLAEYLTRFEGVESESLASQPEGNDRIVFFVEHPVDVSALCAAADQLSGLGHRPILLLGQFADESPVWQWYENVPIIRPKGLDRDALPWLGDVELVVILPGCDSPVWLGSLSAVTLHGQISSVAAAQQIRSVGTADANRPSRSVVFFQRVLWGGGAERVVFDIVRRLNRRRYRPFIFTMFPEHTVSPKLPSDVPVINVIESWLFSSAQRHHEAVDGQEPPPPAASRHWLSGLRRIYHSVLSSKVRERIALARRLRVLQRIRSARVSHSLVSERFTSLPRAQGTKDSPFPVFDFVAAATHHNPAALGLAQELGKIGGDAAVIAVMEEAAVSTWFALAAKRFHYAVSLHSFESKCLRDIYPSQARFKAERKLLSVACNDAEVVTLPSDGCCLDLETHFAVQRARVRKLWNPVDCARVRRMSFQRIDAVKRWQASATCFRIVHVGRLDAQKNHELLLAACAELTRRRRVFSLAIVGDGPEKGGIEKQIDALGLRARVALVGEQSNPFSWMAAADTLMLTSRFESFALVLVEAMVCGTPVISVDCPTGPAEVLESGEFGLLVANNDPVALADAVERLMDDRSLARRLTDSGYERAQVFDVKKIVPQWEALIDALPQGQG